MSNTPDIRFKGFTEPWEQRELCTIADVRDGTHDSPQYLYEGHPFITSKNVGGGYINYNDIQYISDEDFEEINKRSKVDIHDILMGMIGTIGNIALVREKPDFAIKNVALIKNTKAVYYLYLYHYLQSDNVINQLNNGVDGGTQKFIALNKIRHLLITIPKSDEQQKIGNFLENLDQFITLHQRKFVEISELKKFMIQKMFPKAGEQLPEIRFSGFTEPWTQRKLLSSIKKIIDFRGRTPKKLGMAWSESGYLALSALNVKNGWIDPNADAHYGNQELYDKWMLGNELHKGQVLFTTEAPMGNVAQIPDSRRYILSQRTIAFEVDERKIIENYLAVVLGSPLVFEKLTSLSSGGTAKGVSQKSLAEIAIPVPTNLDEQKKLSDYFIQFDNLITLHQRKCDELKNFKKFMLQNMFPKKG